MPTYIALLRGINVGGKNSLPMKEFAALLNDLGCQDVKTYIQSGNAVFASKAKSSQGLAKKIASAIKEHHGFEPSVLVLESNEFQGMIADNPYTKATSDHKSLHLGFLESPPKKLDRKKLDTLRTESESYQVKGRVFYLHAPDGIGRSKLAAGAEKAIGVPMTMRNWRTVEKVLELVEEVE